MKLFPRSGDVVEKTLATILKATEHASIADELSDTTGLLQRIDPRVKLPGLLLLVAAVACSRHLTAIAAIFVSAILFAAFSKISALRLAFWVWLPVLLFTGTIAAPALFLTPGRVLWGYGPLMVTNTGLRSAAFLLSRAGTAATLSALLVLSTRWSWVLKSLRVFRCPAVFVTILGMTYRYIFVLLGVAWDMLESRKSRTVGELPAKEGRRLAAASIGVLLSKSLQLSGDVHLAMQARGFRGEVHLLDDFRMRASDGFWLLVFLAMAVMAFWYGR